MGIVWGSKVGRLFYGFLEVDIWLMQSRLASLLVLLAFGA